MEKDIFYKFFEGTASDQETEDLLAYVEASPENKKRFVDERLIYDAALFSAPSHSTHARLVIIIRRVAAIAAMVALFVGITLDVEHLFASHNPLLQTLSTPPRTAIDGHPARQFTRMVELHVVCFGLWLRQPRHLPER